MFIKSAGKVLLALVIASGLAFGGTRAEGAKAYTIRIGSISSETIPEIKAAYEFKKDIEKSSNGRIKVEVFPNGALGGDRQMAEAVSLGTLDMVLTTTSALTTYEPKFGILDMPFAFPDAQAAFKAVDGDLGQYLNKKLEQSAGMINLGYMLNGVRHMVNGKRPINSPADLAGLKMRVMESPVYIGLFKALGANPTPMSFTEVYTSLQQKTIDGFEVSANFMVEMKFNEVQKYYSLTGHTVSFLVAAMNKNKFDKLPPDLQKMVASTAHKWFVDYQRNVSLSEDSGYIKQLRSLGMSVNEITPDNHLKFVKAVQPVYSDFEKKLGKEVFALLKKYQ
ncbi:TRAP transporter substrate-binding protein [Cloacibacillus evryensis]|uniref:TRAP transporter substrate-binding protein n=1 Tax=Cloacibacillus evryensis TaxID=508460 RepID=A0AAW5K973_9BACT|nr:DctP family TRAP transporter solute-binding subunit [Cloacibacillus evryensis]MCQ4814852.1 TRAP transporter substrate-binding protein [Cloacibacillus evryensis]